MLERIAFAALRLCWLFEITACEIALPFVKDTKQRIELQGHLVGLWMLYRDAENIIPPEIREKIVLVGYMVIGGIGSVFIRRLILLVMR